MTRTGRWSTAAAASTIGRSRAIDGAVILDDLAQPNRLTDWVTGVLGLDIGDRLSARARLTIERITDADTSEPPAADAQPC